MSQNPAALRIVCLTFMLLPGPVGAAWPQGKPAESGPVWKATKVLSVGDALPDEPGEKVLELSGSWWCGPDFALVWARVATGDNGWALVSVREGRVKTVLREAGEATSKYAGEGAEAIKLVKHSFWLSSSSLYPGNGVCYINDVRGRGEIQARAAGF